MRGYALTDLLLITNVPRLRKVFSRIADELAIQLRVADCLEKGCEALAAKKPDMVFVETAISALSGDLLLMHLKKQLGRRRSCFVLLGSADSITPGILKLCHGHIDTSQKDNSLLDSIREFVGDISRKGKNTGGAAEPEIVSLTSDCKGQGWAKVVIDNAKQASPSDSFIKMYRSFFNLKKKPFELLPNPEFLYLSKSHQKAVTLLEHAIHEQAGFVLLTGEIGTGKTTVIRALINKYREHTIISKIFNTMLNPEQLLTMINDDFGLPVANRNKVELLRDLNEFLIDQYGKKNEPLLIIDEAQNLTPEVLEEIRLLSNLETDQSKLIHIILVGQPELRQTLALSGLVQLRQRIAFSCHLQPLMQEEIGEYIAHRLEVAGNREAAVFPREALDIIWRYSGGVPRLINTMCDFFLLSAFTDNTKNISEDLVREVLADLDLECYFGGDGRQGTVSADQTDSSMVVSVAGSRDADNELKMMLEEIRTRLENLEKREPSTPGETVVDAVNSLSQGDQTRDRRVDDIPGTPGQHALSDQINKPFSPPIAGTAKRKKGFFAWLFSGI